MIASNIFNHRNLWITLYLICLLPVTSYRSFLEVNNYHFLDRVSPIRQFTVNINNLHRRRYTIQLASSNFGTVRHSIYLRLAFYVPEILQRKIMHQNGSRTQRGRALILWEKELTAMARVMLTSPYRCCSLFFRLLQ